MNTFPGPPQSDGLSRSCGSPTIEINIIKSIVNKETEELNQYTFNQRMKPI